MAALSEQDAESGGSSIRKVKEVSPQNVDPDGETEGASVSSGVYNLSTTIVGAGIMGLPAKVAISGLFLGLILLVTIGAVAEYSIQLLIRCSSLVKAKSYSDLMEAAYGQKGKNATQGLIIINNLGILVIYLIIIADVLAGSADSLGLLSGYGVSSSWWKSRSAVVLLCLLVLAPLVSLEHVDSLHWSSFFAILLAGVFLIVTIGLTFMEILAGKIDLSNLQWLPTFGSFEALFALFTVIPTISTAYVCHFNVHPIYLEIASPREANMQRVIHISLILCTAIYTVTGLFGYLLFGNNVQADLLANFNEPLGFRGSQVLCDIVRVTFVIHLILVFPLIHYSLRATTASILFPKDPSWAKDKLRFGGLTTALMLTVGLIALLVPNIETAFDFTGSVASVSLAFTLPGLIAVSSVTGVDNKAERKVAWLMVFFGLASSALGLASNIFDVVGIQTNG